MFKARQNKPRVYTIYLYESIEAYICSSVLKWDKRESLIERLYGSTNYYYVNKTSEELSILFDLGAYLYSAAQYETRKIAGR